MPGISRSSQQSQNRTAIVPGTGSLYNQMLKRSSQRYAALGQAQQQAQGRLAQGESAIQGGYGQLNANIQSMIQGIDTSGKQSIAQNAAQQQGQQQQQAINSGLSNSTVLSGMTMANQLYTNQAYNDLSNRMAQTKAGYMSQIGLGQLGSQQQGLGMQTDLSKAYMGDLTGFKFNEFSPITGGFGQSSGSSQSQEMNSPMMGGSGGGGGGQGNIGDVSSGGGNGNNTPYPSGSPVDYASIPGSAAYAYAHGQGPSAYTQGGAPVYGQPKQSGGDPLSVLTAPGNWGN